jgi:hypothetical protein
MSSSSMMLYRSNVDAEVPRDRMATFSGVPLRMRFLMPLLRVS